MPIKLTWKSIVGFLSMVAGVVTSLSTVHGIPHSISAALVGIGGAIVAAERIADAQDNKTSVTAQLASAVSSAEATPVIGPDVKAAVTTVEDKVEEKVDPVAEKLKADLETARADAQAAIDKFVSLSKTAGVVPAPIVPAAVTVTVPEHSVA